MALKGSNTVTELEQPAEEIKMPERALRGKVTPIKKDRMLTPYSANVLSLSRWTTLMTRTGRNCVNSPRRTSVPRSWNRRAPLPSRHWPTECSSDSSRASQMKMPWRLRSENIYNMSSKPNYIQDFKVISKLSVPKLTQVLKTNL